MLKDYLKAGYPALCILTQEPHRAEHVLPCEGWRFLIWDCIRGIRESSGGKVIDEIRDPVQAIQYLNGNTDTVLIIHNLHLFLEIPEVIQSIQNGITVWKSCGCALVMVSPIIQLRPELEKFFHVIDLALPDDEELFKLQTDIGDPLNIKPNKKAARAAKGLTEFEAETAYALSLIRNGYFSTRTISEAKSQIIKKSGLMEFWEPEDINNVGGLQNLKLYIQKRAQAFSPENSTLPQLKGILLVGIPGTGKSLASKATASILGWPLIRLDISALKGSLVGQSELRMRQATGLIDAFGKCVVWIDEIEKAFSGTKSSGETDGGTTASMFGYFLTWMNETNSQVLVMATANNISQLPPELLRAGRFDATFFVDLPVKSERQEIIRIMNKKHNSKIPLSYAENLLGYTGAEIEQLAKDSLYDGLEEAYNNLVPLSRTMREEIQSLREWAKTRARLANTPEAEPEETRKIRHKTKGEQS
ncbi:MAG TPA: AAA family ATPase [Syntrophorhabdaceae bacterium]|nr:AAA family ATPase [Syntrophorhabdaceae bacterium]HRR72727.1 AAA family ATPase [Syntrophorhabdaceae bacterium]HRV23496.1 AAA family ATPase [Syntrophorhabdaceae bacterium]